MVKEIVRGLHLGFFKGGMQNDRGWGANTYLYQAS